MVEGGVLGCWGGGGVDEEVSVRVEGVKGVGLGWGVWGRGPL